MLFQHNINNNNKNIISTEKIIITFCYIVLICLNIPNRDLRAEVSSSERRSIGVSRANIQPNFEDPLIGFSFRKASDVYGLPRVIGELKRKDGLAIIELIGPPENLVEANISIALIGEPLESSGEFFIFMGGLLSMTAPKWERRIDWLIESFRKLPEKKLITTTYDNLRVTLEYISKQGTLVLTVKSAD